MRFFRSADFPVRSNAGTFHGFEKFGNSGNSPLSEKLVAVLNAHLIIRFMRRAFVQCGVIVLGFSIFLGSARSSFSAETPTPSARPALYDTSADGKRQIADALKVASAENKRVILKFGANW